MSCGSCSRARVNSASIDGIVASYARHGAFFSDAAWHERLALDLLSAERPLHLQPLSSDADVAGSISALLRRAQLESQFGLVGPEPRAVCAYAFDVKAARCLSPLAYAHAVRDIC